MLVSYEAIRHAVRVVRLSLVRTRPLAVIISTCVLGVAGKPDQSLAEPYCEEARFFVESRLLQREVNIVLESVNNANYIGSVLHPVSRTLSGSPCVRITCEQYFISTEREDWSAKTPISSLDNEKFAFRACATKNLQCFEAACLHYWLSSGRSRNN